MSYIFWPVFHRSLLLVRHALEMIDGAPIHFCLCPEMMQFMKDEDFLGSSKLMCRNTYFNCKYLRQPRL